MHKLFGAAIAIAALAGSAQAATYDPAAQGPLASNFTYGYITGATFNAFDASNLATGDGCYIRTGASASCLQVGGARPFVGVYFTPVDGQANTAYLFSSDVTLHPGNNGERTAVAFVAPTAGSYNFSGLLRAVDSPAGDGVTYDLAGTTGTLGLRDTPAGTVTFNFTQTLGAGQRAVFSIGQNGTYITDTTGLRLAVAAVPEPATWAMMIGGIGLTGGALRSRRRRATLAAA